MAHMTLPAAHSEADARLAQSIGQALQLEEVHVFWTLPVSVAEGASPRAAAPAPAKAAADPGSGPTGLTGLLAAVVGWLVPQRR